MVRLVAVFVVSLLLSLSVAGDTDHVTDASSVSDELDISVARGFLGYYLDLAGDEAVHDRERGVAALRAGLEARDGDPAAARAAFLSVAELLPGLADWAHVLAADAAARTGDTAAVRALLGNTEPVLASEWGWRSVVRAFSAAGNRTAASAAAADAAARISDAGRAADAWRAAGDLRVQHGDLPGARIAYRHALDLSPGSQHGLAAARGLSELPGATPDDRLLAGRVFLRHGNRERGIAGLDAYVTSGRASPAEIAGLRIEIMHVLFRAGRNDDVERRAAALLETAPTAAVAADALLLLGRAQFRQGRRDQALATFQRLSDRYPSSPATAEALYIMADLEHDAGRFARARQLYGRVVAIAPGSVAGADAAMRLGALHYSSGDGIDAAGIFDSFRESQEDGRRRQQAAFWAGRAHRQAGQDSLARARLLEALSIDAASYYGMRAADLLADGSWRAALAPSPFVTARAALEASGALFRLDVLRDVGLSDAAAYETERLRRYLAQRADGLYAFAEAMHARDEIFTGISIGREIQRREQQWNERLLRIVYPFPYRELILREAARQGVDPYLVAGLIRQESMFNARAVSPAGAIGLMQIMPATGRALARQEGMRNFNNTVLMEPGTNVQLGIRFMAQLLRQYDNRLPDLLAAYNAGPGRLARWRTFPEYRDVDLFAERIPFAETRNYVMIVQQNRRIYEAIYGPRTPATAHGD